MLVIKDLRHAVKETVMCVGDLIETDCCGLRFIVFYNGRYHAVDMHGTVQLSRDSTKELSEAYYGRGYKILNAHIVIED